MKKIGTLVSAMIFISTYASQQADMQESLANALASDQLASAALTSKLSELQPLEVHNDNAHEIIQHIEINQHKKDPTDCTSFTGQELKDCMACQSSQNFRKNLMAFNDRMGRNFLLSLTLEEYFEALSNFNENQWHEYYIHLSPEYTNQFPDTLNRQRAMLKRIFINAYYSNIFSYLWSGQNDLKTDDLEKFISDYNAARYHGEISEQTHMQLLFEFERYRQKLFEQKQ